jgi:crossover junction endodeoxyribonuclease RuvC
MARPSPRVRDLLPELPADHGQRIVVGIDPGTQVVGYGAVVDRRDGPVLLAAGALRAPQGASVPQRLAFIREELDDLLRCLRPLKPLSTALRIGEGRGVALAAAAQACSEVHEITPAEVKKALVGNGQADKGQVAQMVAHSLSLAEAPRPLDASDALAIALTLLSRERFAARTAASR